MCIPAIGGIIGAVGAIASASAQSSAANFQAKMAERQQKIEREKASFNVAQERRNLARTTGTAVAQTAGAGVSFTGSPVTAVADIGTEFGRDIDAIRFGRDETVTGLGAQADVARFNARQARTAGFFSALTPLVSAAGSSFGSGGTFLTSGFPGRSA